jgi:hypothetical protein
LRWTGIVVILGCFADWLGCCRMSTEHASRGSEVDAVCGGVCSDLDRGAGWRGVGRRPGTCGRGKRGRRRVGSGRVDPNATGGSLGVAGGLEAGGGGKADSACVTGGKGSDCARDAGDGEGKCGASDPGDERGSADDGKRVAGDGTPDGTGGADVGDRAARGSEDGRSGRGMLARVASVVGPAMITATGGVVPAVIAVGAKESVNTWPSAFWFFIYGC